MDDDLRVEIWNPNFVVRIAPMTRRDKIEALRDLPQNWNSYGCEAFSNKSVDAALALEPNIPLDFNSIVPIAGGGVQFGKNGDEVTIEIHAAD